MILKRILRVIKCPSKIVWFLNGYRIGHVFSDKFVLKNLYRVHIGKKLNLKNPQTFNEKLQWLKLYDRKPEYTTMVDKYEAKKYVADKIGSEYIIPTFGVWDKFDDIDFDKLPDQFVLKCTHDCGGLVIVKDKSKFDIEEARNKINKCLKRNYYWSNREWPYKNVKPRIIAEQYMEDEETGELRDYKFFCFNGKCKCFKIDFDRYINHRANYYDREKKLLPFGEKVCPPEPCRELKIPDTIEDMIKLAECISATHPFMRVDFYSVNRKIYFGEATLFPNAGIGKFVPNEWDLKLGEMLNINDGAELSE